MKKHLIVSLVFIVVTAGMAVIPLKYHFSEKEVAAIPEYHSYEDVLMIDLPEKLKTLAKKHKCGDYIIPVREIGGDADSLPFLGDDINLGLQAFSGWKLCVDESLKRKMIKRADERFKIWGSMGVEDEMIRLSKTQKDVAMKTRYSAEAKVSGISSLKGDDTKLVLCVNDERYQAKLFEISLTFIHPVTLLKLNRQRAEKLSKMADLKNKAKISTYALAFVLSVFFLYLFSLLVLSLMRRKKTRVLKNFIANEIEKREELIREGHFVTALELADRYLKYFPYDSEIKAFRTRILDYTNNDPEKAQQAYVEWKKLQTRMNNSDYQTGGSLLSQNEKKNIAQLLPYHPELKASYDQLMIADQQAEKKEYDNALKNYELALMSLKEGKIKEALAMLQEIIDIKPDFAKAVDLKKRIDKAGTTKIALRHPQKNNETLAEFFFKQKILLGREDVDNMPDIVFEDRRVSRKHLSIEFNEGEFIVNDLDSSGGTFINGDRLQTSCLSGGDLLNISKVIDYDVSLFQNGGNGCSGLLLKGKDRKLFIVREKIKVPDTMVSVLLCEGLVVLSTDKETIIPADGDEIRLGDDILKVEVTN